jgi:hypothetical protein
LVRLILEGHSKFRGVNHDIHLCYSATDPTLLISVTVIAFLVYEGNSVSYKILMTLTTC